MSASHKIMADALVAIAAVGRGWGTTGEGHARCIEIANKALTEAEHADMEVAYQADATTPSQRLDAATVEQAAISLIVDLCGAGASQSSTNVRVVEDHLRQFARALATDPHQHGGKGA